MIQTFKQFFEEFVQPADGGVKQTDEHKLQLAAAALLIEVARADFLISVEELASVNCLLQKEFNLSDAETGALIEAAQNDVETASSLHPFTSLLNAAWDMPQRINAIEKMWHVALADGKLDSGERHVMRKVASLLYVAQNDLIAAKIRAEQALAQNG